MNDNEILSVLNKMRVEQQTLQGLWGQFSVALARVEVVIKRYQELSKLLPEMEATYVRLDGALTNLEPEFAEKKKAIDKQEVDYRESLQVETNNSRSEAAKARQRVVDAQRDLVDIEKRASDKKAEIVGAIAKLETRLAEVQEQTAKLAKSLQGQVNV